MDDEDLTMVGEHEVLAAIRRAAARPFGPPAATLPPPAPPTPVRRSVPARPAAIELDDDGWWQDEEPAGWSRITRRVAGVVAVVALGALGVAALRSCGGDEAPPISVNQATTMDATA